MKRLLAEITDLSEDEVAPIYVSKPANMGVRAGQPGAKGKKLAVAIVVGPELSPGETADALRTVMWRTTCP